MSNVEEVGAGEGNPGREGGKLFEGAENGLGLFQRGDSFEREKVSAGFRKDGKAIGMKRNQLIETDDVAAVVLSTVVKDCAVGAKRRGDPDTAGIFGGVLRAGLLGNFDGLAQCAFGVAGGGGGILPEFAIAERGNLVAGGGDTVGAGAEIVEVDGGDGGWGLVNDVRRPQGTGDIEAATLEFGGHAAVEHTNAPEVDRVTRRHKKEPGNGAGSKSGPFLLL